MESVKHLVDIFLHLDKYLNVVIQDYGNLTYIILFGIIFCETGLVVIPFLPGDSLIFAAGTFAAIGSLNVVYIFFILSIAAIVGDTVNYHIGKVLGSKIYEKEKLRFIKKEHLIKTQNFYDKYGGKTIILARFVPIVRTFAPFVAGIGKMNYLKFISFNAVGGILWVGICTFGGYYFGRLSFVKNNFSLVALIIIFISILPAIIGYVKEKKVKSIN